MPVTVACVLKSGGDYKPEHVDLLRRQISEALPGSRFVCLNDMGYPGVPLRHNLPGWWSKLEIFDYFAGRDTLYIDLDTVIVGDLVSLVERVHKLYFVVLRDFYRRDGYGSGLMWFNKHYAASHLWRFFQENAAHYMQKFRAGGDQAFLEYAVAERRTIQPFTWQEMAPGEVCSYKVHVKDQGPVPPECKILCFHGKPRPWEIGNVRDRGIRKA